MKVQRNTENGPVGMEDNIKVHVTNLIAEIMTNPNMGIFRIPLNELLKILESIATRASQLNDVELNKLMMRLALYEISDPTSKEYDSKFVNDYLMKKETN